MFKKIFEIVSKEFSGQNAKELIGEIAKFHRIQSSPGFRAAAKFCHETVEKYSIPFIRTHEYPAKGSNRYWSCPVSKEWAIKSASLDLVEPKGEERNLSRFFEDACSVIQRSAPTPQEGITAEVVILPKDLDKEEIKKMDLKGKFVLTDDPDLKKIRLIAVKEKGAAGLIYDLVSELRPVRTRANFPTARRYTSFWYGVKGWEEDALGFVLSAQQGDDLRKLIQKVEKENKEAKKKGTKEKNVKVHAKIDSSFYDGKMEVVEFFIPGREADQEVLAVAHLCHPKPGAVDNASGCGTLIEVARTLQTLISQGKLEQPQRGIRFLLMAEFTGTFCYLASNEQKIKDFVAGINLDMVGADQTIGGGRTLIQERTHNSLPSFVNDVLGAFLGEASKEIPNFTNTSAIATFKYAADQPFSGGSDHVVLGDPDIGVGTPMLIQWPDKFYHSGEDTIEKVSPNMLQLVGSMTGAYCYLIANAKLPEMLWMAREVATKGQIRITSHGRKMANELLSKLHEEKAIAESSEEEKDKKRKKKLTREQHVAKTLERVEVELDFRRDIELKALDSIKKLATNNKDAVPLEELLMEMKGAIKAHTDKEISQTKLFVERIASSMNIKAEPLPKAEKTELVLEAEKLVPRRVFRGPITRLSLTDITLEEEKEFKNVDKEFPGMRSTLQSAMFWVDGKKTLSEIATLVENNHGKVSIPYLVKMVKLYKKHGLLDF